MGLHDREYMKESAGRSTTLHVLRPAWVKLLLLNVLLFFLGHYLTSSSALHPFAVSGQGLADGHFWTLITCSFAHESLWQLFWCMLFLYWLGGELEVIYGGGNLVTLYLFGGGAAAASHLAGHALWGDVATPCFCGSGAALAVVVATTLFYPAKPLRIWGLFSVPLWVLTALFVLMDLSGVLHVAQRGGSPGLLALSHLAGVAAGAAFKLLDLRPFSPRTPEGVSLLGPGLFSRFGRRLRRAPSVVPLDDRISSPRRPRAGLAADLALRVDEVLRKISRDGMGSLSPEERDLLDEASKKYRASGRFPRPAEGPAPPGGPPPEGGQP